MDSQLEYEDAILRQLLEDIKSKKIKGNDDQYYKQYIEQLDRSAQGVPEQVTTAQPNPPQEEAEQNEPSHVEEERPEPECEPEQDYR